VEGWGEVGRGGECAGSEGCVGGREKKKSEGEGCSGVRDGAGAAARGRARGRARAGASYQWQAGRESGEGRIPRSAWETDRLVGWLVS
jgi:hypothetical protein